MPTSNTVKRWNSSSRAHRSSNPASPNKPVAESCYGFFLAAPSIQLTQTKTFEFGMGILMSLARHADLAMYQAKQAGRDNVKLFDAEIQDH